MCECVHLLQAFGSIMCFAPLHHTCRSKHQHEGCSHQGVLAHQRHAHGQAACLRLQLLGFQQVRRQLQQLLQQRQCLRRTLAVDVLARGLEDVGSRLVRHAGFQHELSDLHACGRSRTRMFGSEPQQRLSSQTPLSIKETSRCGAQLACVGHTIAATDHHAATQVVQGS